jgi:hypothetical protein
VFQKTAGRTLERTTEANSLQCSNKSSAIKGTPNALSWQFGWHMKCFAIPVKVDHFARMFDFLLIYFTVGVDLCAHYNGLWKAILSGVECWNWSQTGSTNTPSLQRAKGLLHTSQTSKFGYNLTTSCTEQSDQKISKMRLSAYSINGNDLSLARHNLLLLFN